MSSVSTAPQSKNTIHHLQPFTGYSKPSFRQHHIYVSTFLSTTWINARKDQGLGFLAIFTLCGGLHTSTKKGRKRAPAYHQRVASCCSAGEHPVAILSWYGRGTRRAGGRPSTSFHLPSTIRKTIENHPIIEGYELLSLLEYYI